MTQEDKELLLKDLCARLPYGVKVCSPDKKVCSIWSAPTISVVSVINGSGQSTHPIKDIKPYLRPMSSMTEEEKYIYRHMLGATLNSEGESIMFVYEEDFSMVMDWLNENHFDYRGLIEKGLALEAPEGIYNV